MSTHSTLINNAADKKLEKELFSNLGFKFERINVIYNSNNLYTFEN